MAEKNIIPQHSPYAQQDTVDLVELASILLTHWWKIAIATLLSATLALAVANARYVPTYQASAKLIINNSRVNIGMTQVSINAGDLTASQGLVSIYSEFLDSHLVLDAAGEALAEKGIPGYSYSNLRGRVSTSAVGTTPIVRLTAWDYSPENAIAIVNTLVETLPEQAGRVIEGSSVIAIDPAYSASVRAYSLRRQGAIGAMAGFAFSCGLVLLYYYFLNDLIQRQEWMLDSYPMLPSLGVVPDTTNPADSPYGYGYGYNPAADEDSEKKKKKSSRRSSREYGSSLNFYSVEAYNAIRTNIKFSFHSSGTGRVIGITSATMGDGKTYTSANLAYAMAKDNSKVLLIDGDLRKMTLNQFYHQKPSKGLADVLSGQAEAESSIVQHVSHDHLDVLFAGSLPPNPSELLGSLYMKELLDALRSRYDYILIDLPPIGSVIDAAAVSGYVDGIIVVVRHNHTHRKFIRSTMRQLEQSGARLLGFVYNANVERYSLYGRYYKRYYRAYYKKEQE